MTVSASHGQNLDPPTGNFYRAALRALSGAGIPFLVGGAYAFHKYTGISRETKDFDLFVRPGDAQRALDALEESGYITDLTFPHWLGKAFHGEASVDIIYCSGNGRVRVDDEWFNRAVHDTVLDIDVGLCPPEEMIRSKAYIMERERFDGADIAHIIRARGDAMDWRYLIDRFGSDGEVLYVHLILFSYIYPTEQASVPAWVLQELQGKINDRRQEHIEERVCRGTMLSRQQYLVDIGAWGYIDARLLPPTSMTKKDIAHWTAAIEEGK